MIRATFVALLALRIGRINLAVRNRLKEDSDELDLVESHAVFERGPMIPWVWGLGELKPLCGERLLANISMYKAIETFPFTWKKGGGIIASSAFKDIAQTFSTMRGPISVAPGMSLYFVETGGTQYSGPWKNEKQIIRLINEQITRHGSAELVFDAGLDTRACWRNMLDANGLQVCGRVVMRDLAMSLQTFPAKVPTGSGKRAQTIVANYPRFIFKSIYKERDSLAAAMRNIFVGSANFEAMYGSVYGSGLAPVCFVIPGFDGTDWLVRRKVELSSSARSIYLDGAQHFDLKGPMFAGNRDPTTSYDNPLGRGTVRRDPDFVARFPHGITVHSCGGREVAFSLEKDAKLLAASEMTDYILMIKFYDAELFSMQQCNSDTFPIILNVVSPLRFRIALGIIDYVEQTTSWLPRDTVDKPNTYHRYWMHMWPNYFHFSTISPLEYRVELFAKRIRGFQVSKVVALMRLQWSEVSSWYRPYRKDIIHEDKAWLIKPSSAYEILPGELGSVEGEAEAGLVVRWGKYASGLFWVPPQSVMPVPR